VSASELFEYQYESLNADGYHTSYSICAFSSSIMMTILLCLCRCSFCCSSPAYESFSRKLG